MRLRSLELADFRNFESARVPFGERFTVLHGRNGAGKTNVLEALYLLSTLRSFRGADLKSMMRRGQPAAQIQLAAYDPSLGVPTQLSVRIEAGARATRRTARVDQKLIRAASDFYGRLSAVLFTPEDLNILRGSPKGRRQFLDRVLFARHRAHITDITDYEKLLRSRNRLLKDSAGRMPDPHLLETYEAGIIECGARITQRRATLVEHIAPGFRTAFAQIHDLDGTEAHLQHMLACTLSYRSSIDTQLGVLVGATTTPPVRDPVPEQANPASALGSQADAAQLEARMTGFRRALLETRSKDLARGTTSVGPHRDELEVQLDGSPAIHFASQGQTRALVLAFKIAELRQTRELRGQAPLLLLDDVTSELDPRRNAQLFEALAGEVGQCVLTTTAPEFIRLPASVQRLDLRVEAGAVEALTP